MRIRGLEARVGDGGRTLGHCMITFDGRNQEVVMARIRLWKAALIPFVAMLAFTGSPRGSEVPGVGVKDPSTAEFFGKPVRELGDGDLGRLQGAGGILQLELRDSKVTDAGLALVGKVEGLQRLWLEGPGITDKGVEHLKDLKSLRILGLERTRVTDQVWKELKGLSDLRLLLLRGTKVTENGLIDLQKALPNCRIVWGGVAKAVVQRPRVQLGFGRDPLERAGYRKFLAKNTP